MLLDEVEKINLIESFNIETKAYLDREDSQGWLKTIAGFANAEGGILYIGVEDKTNKLIGFDRRGGEITNATTSISQSAYCSCT